MDTDNTDTHSCSGCQERELGGGAGQYGWIRGDGWRLVPDGESVLGGEHTIHCADDLLYNLHPKSM